MRTTPPGEVLATLAIASAFALACSSPAPLAADLLITRANIWTGNPRQPDAHALAILGDRIAEVGSAGEIERWRGPNTTVIDAEGRRLLPGFNDAHVHFMDGGAQLDSVDLKDADTPAEFARRIGERAKAKPGERVLGGDWDDQRWTPAQLPTRDVIDDATNGTPVFVVRYDGHMARATLDGKNPGGWVPDQKITIQEAIAAYSTGSAFAEFQEGEKGTIARGKLADLVILSDDVFAIPAAAIQDVKVLTTVVGGKVVHQRNA